METHFGWKSDLKWTVVLSRCLLGKWSQLSKLPSTVGLGKHKGNTRSLGWANHSLSWLIFIFAKHPPIRSWRIQAGAPGRTNLLGFGSGDSRNRTQFLACPCHSAVMWQGTSTVANLFSMIYTTGSPDMLYF